MTEEEYQRALFEAAYSYKPMLGLLGMSGQQSKSMTAPAPGLLQNFENGMQAPAPTPSANGMTFGLQMQDGRQNVLPPYVMGQQLQAFINARLGYRQPFKNGEIEAGISADGGVGRYGNKTMWHRPVYGGDVEYRTRKNQSAFGARIEDSGRGGMAYYRQEF